MPILRKLRHSDLRSMNQYELEAEAQRRAEERIDILTAELYDEDELPDGYESPAVAPYCGCLACKVREILSAAYPPLAESITRFGRVDVD